MISTLIIFDKFLFLIITINVFYLLFFSFFSLKNTKHSSKFSPKKSKFLVLIPAFKEDKVIMNSVNSVLAQDYPIENFDLIVISDRMSEQTNTALSNLLLKLLVISPEISTKGRAMSYAMSVVDNMDYDLVAILDADNIVDNKFLANLNDAYYSGSKAIQAHRVAKSINSEMAVLDAISEEINNSIFRLGHVNIGLSSALIGSGMAIEYKLFKSNCKKLVSTGEDKELEILLLRDGVYIDFLNDVFVYDQKVDKEDAFYNQRRRWLASQLWSLYTGIKYLPKAIVKNNIDYIDKIFQWTMLPRIILIGFIAIMIGITTLFKWQLSLKWWVVLFLLTFAFVMAIPDYLVSKKNSKALKRLPILFFLMLMNFFRLRGASKNFIHTKKG